MYHLKYVGIAAMKYTVVVVKLKQYTIQQMQSYYPLTIFAIYVIRAQIYCLNTKLEPLC